MKIAARTLLQPMIFFWISLILLLAGFTFFVPPFQKPDEPTHFYKAISLYYGHWKPVLDPESTKLYFPIPTSVYDFPDTFRVNEILMRSDIKFPISLYNATYPWKDDTTVSKKFTNRTLPPLGYLIFLPGIALSKPFDNLTVTFFFSRISAALFFLLCLLVGLRVIPVRYRPFLLFFCLTPMVLHQVSAISYDAPSLSLAILMFSIFLRMIEKTNVSFWGIGLFTVLTFVFNEVKGSYYATYLLPVILIFRMIRKKFGVNAGWLLFIGSWVSVAIFFLAPSLTGQFFPGGSYQEQYIFSDPLYFVSTLVRSIFSEQTFWVNGLVGTFGWLDYMIPYVAIIAYFLVFGSICYHLVLHDTKRLTFGEILAVLFVPFGTYVIIVYHFLLYETPVAYPNVMSVQGRYFLPVIPFLVYGLSQLTQFIGRRKMLTAGIAVGCAGLCLAVGAKMYLRYYDYSKTFSNLPDLQKKVEEGSIKYDDMPITIASQSSFSVFATPDRKIGGFQVVTANGTNTPVVLPYRYTIADGDCMHVLATGVIDKTMMQKSGITTIYTPVIPVSTHSLCLAIGPAIDAAPEQGYWQVQTVQTVPVIQFLYISQ